VVLVAGLVVATRKRRQVVELSPQLLAEAVEEASPGRWTSDHSQTTLSLSS